MFVLGQLPRKPPYWGSLGPLTCLGRSGLRKLYVLENLGRHNNTAVLSVKWPETEYRIGSENHQPPVKLPKAPRSPTRLAKQSGRSGMVTWVLKEIESAGGLQDLVQECPSRAGQLVPI